MIVSPPVGLATNPDRPTLLSTSAGPILEVPPLMGTFFSRRAILGGGVCSRQIDMAWGQRVRNTQPDGGWNGDGEPANR